jgi:pimeloyl-ACP methyl ester carboxylesterase
MEDNAMPENLMEDRYVKVGNINTRFWIAGTEGTPVLLIHRAGGCIENWQPNINALGQKHRVYALDLAGSGISDKPTVQYSVPFLAQFVFDFFTIQNVQKVYIIGNSMGGVPLPSRWL